MLFCRKGIVILGPVSSGKSTLLQIAAYVLKKGLKKVMKKTVISPQTFTQPELMGLSEGTGAYYSNEASLFDSIFSLIIKGYQEGAENEREAQSTIKTIVFDTDVQEYWSEWFIRFVLDTNQFSHSFSQFENDLSGNSNTTFPVRLSNGIILEFPQDLYLLFETTSLSEASPRFISSMGFIFLKDQFVNWKMIMSKNIKVLFKENEVFFATLGLTLQGLNEIIEK
jgi:energy-coupling factor transporter ATP-binding protein EcfA2